MLCVCVCVCVYVYVCVHAWVHVCACVRARVGACVCVCLCVRVCFTEFVVLQIGRSLHEFYAYTCTDKLTTRLIDIALQFVENQRPHVFNIVQNVCVTHLTANT